MLRGTVALLALLVNTLLWCSVLFVLALVRLALPFKAVRRVLDPWLNAVATTWVAGNSAWMRLTQRTEWDVQGLDALTYESWYLVLCNHQSWADIFVLQHLLNRRVPMLKFFIKHELIYVPVIGLAWWALDFPFMRRHSDAELRAHPEKREQDIEAARRACAKFALVPTSVMNFVEGTRFTPAKHAAQKGRFKHLLNPKAGGLAMALSVLGGQFHSLLDVTIAYPDGVPGFWDFLCGRTKRIVVRVQQRQIPAECRSSESGALPPNFRKSVLRWLLELWQQKDELLDRLLQSRDP
jgi:1-acyl-sn-glycerol-3-phosphate acyltransferase